MYLVSEKPVCRIGTSVFDDQSLSISNKVVYKFPWRFEISILWQSCCDTWAYSPWSPYLCVRVRVIRGILCFADQLNLNTDAKPLGWLMSLCVEQLGVQLYWPATTQWTAPLNRQYSKGYRPFCVDFRLTSHCELGLTVVRSADLAVLKISLMFNRSVA